MLPSEPVNREMYAVNLKTNNSWPVHVTHESKSGETVLTTEGRVMRTNSKYSKVFHSSKIARLAIKANMDEFDSEFYQLCHECGLVYKGLTDKSE